MENRREKQRYNARIKGHLWIEGRKVAIETVNLSESGVRIVLDAPLLEGADVKLRLCMSLNRGTQTELITGNGVVVWCNEDMDAGYQAGIRFVTLPDDQCLYLMRSLPTYPPA